jgi:CRISPR-associated protein Cas1
VINRILDFSDSPARLSVRHNNLVVEPQDQPATTMPLSDIAVLVVSHPQVRYTHAVLAGLAASGGIFITCGQNRLPVGMLLPLDAHFTQVERFTAQASASKPLKKRLWQQIVRAKVLAQARLLEELHGSDFGLSKLVPQVASGDPSNIEARAARQYWQLLFGDKEFRRARDLEDQNTLLNYGYAVLRAIVARAICSVGLHPALGVHHHNRYSSYPLADDLMEPLRPAVDRGVVEMVRRHGDWIPLNPSIKRELLGYLLGRFDFEGEQRTLFDLAARTASSLVDCFMNQGRQLCLPSV